MIPYFDAHCDTISRCLQEGLDVNDPALQNSAAQAKGFGPRVQIYAFFTDKGGYPMYRKLLERARKELAGADHQYLFSIEGAEGIDCDPEKLPQVYQEGVRAINLCWNYDNALTGAAMGGGGGLTEQGRRFVQACEKVGIVPDMSHVSDRGFWDTLEVAKKPIIASHSDSRALCPVPRNLTDEQFKALAAAGGCVGLNYCTAFLGLGQDLEAVLAHAEHFLALGGEKALGLGSDFDGCDVPEELSGVGRIPQLYEAMLRRNWPESLVQDIFYNNFKRVFDEYPDLREE